jgi:hypothetical protein
MWKAGDVAIVWCPDGQQGTEFNGMECTLVTRLDGYRGCFEHYWEVSGLDPVSNHAVREACLRRRPQPPDWNEIATRKLIEETA